MATRAPKFSSGKTLFFEKNDPTAVEIWAKSLDSTTLETPSMARSLNLDALQNGHPTGQFAYANADAPLPEDKRHQFSFGWSISIALGPFKSSPFRPIASVRPVEGIFGPLAAILIHTLHTQRKSAARRYANEKNRMHSQSTILCNSSPNVLNRGILIKFITLTLAYFEKSYLLTGMFDFNVLGLIE